MPNGVECEEIETSIIKYQNSMSLLNKIKNLINKIFKKTAKENYFDRGNFILLGKDNKEYFKGPHLEEFDRIENRFEIKELLQELNNIDFKKLYIKIIEEYEIADKALQEDTKIKILTKSDEFDKDISELNEKYFYLIQDYYKLKKVKTIQIAYFISDLAALEEKLIKKYIFYLKTKIKGLEKLNYIEEQNSINIEYYSYIKKVNLNNEEIDKYIKLIEEYERKILMYGQMHKYFSNIILEEDIQLYEYFDIYMDSTAFLYKNYKDERYKQYINLFNEIFKAYLNYIKEFCNKDLKKDIMIEYANCYMSIGEGNILNKDQEDIVNYIYDLNKK